MLLLDGFLDVAESTGNVDDEIETCEVLGTFQFEDLSLWNLSIGMGPPSFLHPSLTRRGYVTLE